MAGRAETVTELWSRVIFFTKATDNTQMCSSNIYLNSVLHFDRFYYFKIGLSMLMINMHEPCTMYRGQIDGLVVSSTNLKINTKYKQDCSPCQRNMLTFVHWVLSSLTADIQKYMFNCLYFKLFSLERAFHWRAIS